MNFLQKNMYILLTLYLLNYWGLSLKLFVWLAVYNCSEIIWLTTNQIVTWPTTLMYGFNLIHPMLFYTTLIFSYTYIQKTQLHQQTTIKFYLFTGLSALIFGMYWGGINEVWGFFWTYDQIEFLLFCLLILIVYYIHSIQTLSSSWVALYIYYTLIVYLISLRFNVFFTVHSFFDKNTIPILFLFELLSFLIKVTSLLSLSYFLYLCVLIYFFTKLLLFFGYRTKVKKLVVVLHLSLLITVLLIVNPAYYYSIVSLNSVSIIEYIQVSLNTYVNFLLQIHLSQVLIQQLNAILSGLQLFNVTNNFLYLNYLGFFYYVFFIYIVSSFKIYVA